MRSYLVYCALLICSPAAAHNTLLPQPQELHYGPGRLPLKGLSIRFAAPPAPEDRFVARELASWLSGRAGVPEVGGGAPRGPAIVLKRTGAVNALALPDETAGPDSRESYAIKITSGMAEVTARSSAGLYYAAQTLRQMVEDAASEDAFLPEVELRDWPSLPYRGYMMDMSHVQLPTVAAVKDQLEFLARFKTNQYYFYSEASIELAGYPLLMPEARFTRAQVKEVVEYGRERHIDVIPNVEWYGHLHDLFRLERYADLSVIPHGGEFNRQDTRILPLLEDWAGQLASLFPSPFFHIGFDETWLIKHEAAKRNIAPEQLYLAQLKEVTAIVEKLGKHPMAYADMLQKFPQIVPQVPRPLTVVAWHYQPMPDAEFDRKLSPFSSAGLRTVVQSAVRNWNWLSPDYDGSFANVDTLLAAGRRHKVAGLIQSGWTDDSQNLTRSGRPAWAYSSASAWQSQPLDRLRFFSQYTAVLYPPSVAGDVARGLESLARAETLLQEATGGGTEILWEDPFTRGRLTRNQEQKAKLRQVRLAAEEAREHLMGAIAGGVDMATLKCMLVGARMVDIAAMKCIYAAEIANFWAQIGPHSDPEDAWNILSAEIGFKYHSRTADMMDALVDVQERFREAWLADFTPFRLGVATAKFDAEFQAWWKLQRRITKAAGEAKNGLPPLESVTGGLW